MNFELELLSCVGVDFDSLLRAVSLEKRAHSAEDSWGGDIFHGVDRSIARPDQIYAVPLLL